MLECLIIGDSIAVGTKMFAPTMCTSYAHSGWTSNQWNSTYLNQDLSAGIVVISLGSNDNKYIHTENELRKLRNNVHGKKIFWILPHGNNPQGGVSIEYIQKIVQKIAKEHGDIVVPIKQVQPDSVHPTANGYKEIIKDVGL